MRAERGFQMQYRNLIEIESRTDNEARALFEALRLENKQYDRSSIKVMLKKKKVVVEIQALDKSAFFASTNAIHTLIRAIQIK